jgi:hypothetical protein
MGAWIDGFLQLAPAINGSVTPSSIPEVKYVALIVGIVLLYF